jgi:hypothetical protein
MRHQYPRLWPDALLSYYDDDDGKEVLPACHEAEGNIHRGYVSTMNGKRLAFDFDQEVVGVFVRPLTRVAVIVYSKIIPLPSQHHVWLGFYQIFAN